METKTLNSNKGKLLSVISIIARILLTVGVVGWIVISVVKSGLTDAWDIFYASIALVACEWAAIIGLVVYIVSDFKRVLAAMKEAIRKFFVSLKRNPSIIPLVMMLLCFLVFSLNLTDLSNSTAKIQGKGMGLSQFCIMLFSLLSMVCMLNAFPRRKKPNIPMIVLMFAMFAIIIFCDVHYCNAIMAAMTRAESPIKIDKTTEYIANAYNMLNVHKVLIIVAAVLVALLPVYSKLLKKINTSVAVEDNGAMEELELND